MQRHAIVQMFNQPFAKVEKDLARLDRLGFSHVLISPPQKSHSSRSWWGRYQPVDFRAIEGPLGTRWELESLCRAAARRGMAVAADTVLQHMSNEPRYVRMRGARVLEANFPQFSAADFRLPGECGRAFHGRGRALPVLRGDSPWVRQKLREYVHMLYGLGVRAFRFDAAKHLDPELVRYVLSGLPRLLCFGEMVYARAGDFPPLGNPMQAYDFPLARSLKRALERGGDLRSLMSPGDGALWGPVAVTFVNHHDMIKNRRHFAYFRLADPRDRQLAYAFMLARGEGTPLVYSGDLRLAEVKAGLSFHNLLLGRSLRWLLGGPNFLVWARGHEGLAAVNKSGQPWSVGVVDAALHPGAYRDLLSREVFWADLQGRLHHFWVPPRSARLLLPNP